MPTFRATASDNLYAADRGMTAVYWNGGALRLLFVVDQKIKKSLHGWYDSTFRPANTLKSATLRVSSA